MKVLKSNSQISQLNYYLFLFFIIFNLYHTSFLTLSLQSIVPLPVLILTTSPTQEPVQCLNFSLTLTFGIHYVSNVAIDRKRDRQRKKERVIHIHIYIERQRESVREIKNKVNKEVLFGHSRQRNRGLHYQLSSVVL